MDTKKCSKCCQEKIVEQFAIYDNKLFCWCEQCQRDSNKKYRQKYPERIKQQTLRYGEKNPDYSARHCREWRKKYPERYHQKLKEQRLKKIAKDPLWDRRKNLWRQYRIRLEQYEAMYKNQNGACAICGGINLSGRMLVVDHNHKTQKIRALLCCTCNSAIGLLRENPNLFDAAKNYLLLHEAKAELMGDEK